MKSALAVEREAHERRLTSEARSESNDRPQRDLGGRAGSAKAPTRERASRGRGNARDSQVARHAPQSAAVFRRAARTLPEAGLIAFGFVPPRTPERVRADAERERERRRCKLSLPRVLLISGYLLVFGLALACLLLVH